MFMTFLRSLDGQVSEEVLGQLHGAARSLSAEFVGVFSPETVDRAVADSASQLLPETRVTMHLPMLAQRFARERLRALARAEGSDRRAESAVLFVCLHNSGRSQIAAAWMRHFCGDRVTVSSGGAEPAAHLNELVLTAMAEVGIDLSDEYPKPWTDEVVAGADVVITMGCGDACPVLPGKRYEDWSLVHSTGPTIDDARAARDELKARVQSFASSLTATQ
jgi:protein-tyrosine-phosphatase